MDKNLLLSQPIIDRAFARPILAMVFTSDSSMWMKMKRDIDINYGTIIDG
jgi:hypothetical protein